MQGIKTVMARRTGESAEERRSKTVEKILKATVSLFEEQGYEKTTMRQIAARAGLLTGSVYNVFKSKEDIFEVILLRSYDNTMLAYKQLIADDGSFLIALAFPMGVALHYACNDPRSCEALSKALSSWTITNHIVDRTLDWTSDYFEKYNLSQDMATRKFYFQVLLGSVSTMIERIRNEARTEFSEELTILLELFCALFRLSAMDVPDVVRRMVEILKKFDISITSSEVRIQTTLDDHIVSE